MSLINDRYPVIHPLVRGYTRTQSQADSDRMRHLLLVAGGIAQGDTSAPSRGAMQWFYGHGATHDVVQDLYMTEIKRCAPPTLDSFINFSGDHNRDARLGEAWARGITLAQFDGEVAKQATAGVVHVADPEAADVAKPTTPGTPAPILGPGELQALQKKVDEHVTALMDIIGGNVSKVKADAIAASELGFAAELLGIVVGASSGGPGVVS